MLQYLLMIIGNEKLKYGTIKQCNIKFNAFKRTINRILNKAKKDYDAGYAVVYFNYNKVKIIIPLINKNKFFHLIKNRHLFWYLLTELLLLMVDQQHVLMISNGLMMSPVGEQQYKLVKEINKF